MHLIDRISEIVGRVWFCDRARPVEWLSVLALSGWAQFLLQSADVFSGPRYAAFTGLPPLAWALIIGAIIGAQIATMTPLVRSRVVRFYAMAAASGIWAVIAFNFWSSDTAPISARTASSIAIVCAMTGVHLGWASRKF